MCAFEPLDRDLIRRDKGEIGHKVVVFDCTSSTNDAAMAYARSQSNHGVAIFAEEQTKGRGRGARVWSAKKYSSILCSILLTKTRVKGEMVAISSALAVMDALPLGVHNQAQIKWPNDVLVNGRKIAGILVESSRQEFGVCHIVGIGINCDQKADDIGAELRDIATSITIENFACSSRNLIAGRLLSAFEHRLKQAENDPGTIVELSKKLSSLINTRVSLKFNNRSFTGRCVDIDPLGGIVLQLDGGGVRMFDAAHTTLGSLKG